MMEQYVSRKKFEKKRGCVTPALLVSKGGLVNISGIFWYYWSR
jgi:hypothetical protein